MSVKGLKELISKIESLRGDLPNKIESVVSANARELERNAKSLAPVDLGTLRRSIKALGVDDLTWKVVANSNGLAPYAAYIEFGTGGMVSVPNELREVANRFRGKGRRKIDMRPQPYMYPSLVKQRQIFLDDLEQILEKETKAI